MIRYVSIFVIFFMVAPMFTPIAGALESCGEECALGQGHECKYGKTCPMHRKKGADNSRKGHESHQDNASHQERAARDNAGHHGHHGQHVKTDKSLICTVSSTAGEKSAEHEQPCFIMSGCDHDKDPLSLALGADYLVSKSHFTPFKTTDFIRFFRDFRYQGHVPDLLERPPLA